jgi:hypothetical protein
MDIYIHTWTFVFEKTHQLISMIEIIDRLYPEEGVKGNIPTRIGHEGLEDIGLTQENDEQ